MLSLSVLVLGIVFGADALTDRTIIPSVVALILTGGVGLVIDQLGIELHYRLLVKKRTKEREVFFPDVRARLNEKENELYTYRLKKIMLAIRQGAQDSAAAYFSKRLPEPAEAPVTTLLEAATLFDVSPSGGGKLRNSYTR